MDIEHRITLAASRGLARRLGKLGIEAVEGFNTIVMMASDPRWPALKAVQSELGLLDIASAVFDDKEIAAAETVAFYATAHRGYPEPSDTAGYLDATYDLSAYCAHCGVGKKQKAAFRFKTEPTWKRRSVVQLNWVFDEFFVSPSTWEKAFKPLGVGRLPVLNTRGTTEFSNVVQLDISRRVDVDITGLPFEDCLVCSRRKFQPVADNFMPRPLDSEAPVFKSSQEFGSGALASRICFSSRSGRLALEEAALTGLNFLPTHAVR